MRIGQTRRASRRGQVAVEYALLLGAMIPLGAIIIYLFGILAEMYRMVSFFETLPFP